MDAGRVERRLPRASHGAQRARPRVLHDGARAHVPRGCVDGAPRDHSRRDDERRRRRSRERDDRVERARRADDLGRFDRPELDLRVATVDRHVPRHRLREGHRHYLHSRATRRPSRPVSRARVAIAFRATGSVFPTRTTARTSSSGRSRSTPRARASSRRWCRTPVCAARTRPSTRSSRRRSPR